MTGQVVESYSGRKDVVFNQNELEEFLSNCRNGDKIKMEVLPDGYKVSVDERYKQVLSVAEQTTKMKLTETREAGNALIRSIVAYRLVKEGYHYSEIGKAMGRNHSTISHYIRKVENMLSVPFAYRREICLFKEFERLLDE
jgi:chromosomal replication initiation ATPase DnaA